MLCPHVLSPPVLNKSFTITAGIEIPKQGADGMVITQGGLTGGYGLYLRDDKAHFVYNLLALERFTPNPSLSFRQVTSRKKMTSIIASGL